MGIAKKKKITFTEEKETLLIPLFGKALESRKKNPVLVDHMAEEIVSQIEYDFSRLNIPEKTNVMSSLRAKKFDDYTVEFLQKNPGSIVIYLGCGLDSRYNRIGKNTAKWYDLDFPEVIAIKKKFLKEGDKYHFIKASVTDLDWIKKIPDSKKPVLILAEGLFMYLHEEEIKSLIKALMEKFKTCTLVFDCFSKLTSRQATKHPSLKKTGASIHWGIDDPKEIESWAKGIHFLEDWGFSDSSEIHRLKPLYRFLFNALGRFRMVRNAHRILYYNLKNK